MAIHYEHNGTNPDGSPHFNIWSDDPTATIVLTGPIVGPVVVDGQSIDVSAPYIEVPDQAFALKVSDAIGLRHVAEGHPDFISDDKVDSFGFVHVSSEGIPYINAAAAPETIASIEAQVEASPDIETGSLVKVEV